jgi:hypothetical protein
LSRRRAFLAVALLLLSGCKARVTQAECDQLLTRFAELVVTDRYPVASPEILRAERARAQAEAAGDDNFKNCTTELRQDDYRCAMAATTSEALLKCLE